jgi:hypothetical protein
MPSPLHRVLSFDRQMGIGVAGSWQVSVSAVAKCNGPTVPYCVPNELICSEIGRFLRLPLPPAGIVDAPHAPQRYWFASLDFNLTGNSMPPVNAVRCAVELPDLSTGLILFDVLVGNVDRHPGNFSIDFASNPPQMNIFDHSHAMFGSAAGGGQALLTANRNQLTIGAHCLLQFLSVDTFFVNWIERIEAIPDFFIEEVVEQSSDYGVTIHEATEAVSFLKYRRNNMRNLITGNKPVFRGITNWRLL